jgi:hypothetical protein
MTALTITGKVPPPVTIANISPSDGLGLRFSTRRGVLCLDTSRGNAGVAGAKVTAASHAPRRSGVMLPPSRMKVPN